jgi:hypothetical protein
MKKIIYAASLALSTLTLSFSALADTAVWGVNRFILQYQNGTPAPFVSLLDPGHTKMSSGEMAGVYTQADVDKLKSKALAYFEKVVGLQFTGVCSFCPAPYTGFPLASDQDGPAAILLPPFSIGFPPATNPTGPAPYNVLYDSGASYKNSEKWTIRNFSYIMAYLRPGTVYNGTAAGQKFQANDVMSYGYTDHLAIGKDWTNDANREHFIVSTIGPQKQPANASGLTDQHIALQYIDENGNVGFGSDNVFNNNPGNSATNRIVHHPVYFLANPATAVTVPD